VRGSRLLLSRSAPDFLEHTLGVLQNVVIPESQNQIAHGFDNSRSIQVFSQSFGVLTAIQFDNEPRFRTAEINDEAIDRHLPSKLQTTQSPISQPKPKHTLSIRLLATKAFG
jgi:hypothetical protein